MASKKFLWWQWLAGGIGLWLIVLLLSFGSLVVQLKANKVASAVRTSYVAEIALEPLRLITLYRDPDLELLQQSLRWLRSSQTLMSLTQDYARIFWPESVAFSERQTKTKLWQTATHDWLTQGKTVATQFQKSRFKKLTPIELQQNFEPQIFGDVETFLTEMSSGEKSWLVLFQNSEELRATGGFIGSYARIDFADGMMTNFEIQDIYQPDGQFQGFVPAPKGVAEFLSSGKGLRLPDANWWPDFPRSAQTILQYFAFGKEQRVIGVVAVNLQLAEDVLRVFGPVTLTDYDVTVTAENLSKVARADRMDFFPGSKQKAHFLTLLFNQLKLRVETASPEQLFSLAKLWRARITAKDWQWYSPDEALQQISQRYQLSGETKFASNDPNQLYLQLIESNIGINKANAGMTRTVDLQLLPTQLQILLRFANHQTKPIVTTAELLPALVETRSELKNGLGYVNYQRLLVSPYLKVASIFVGDQPVTQWDEETIELSGLTLKQLGFVVTVPEASKQQVQIVLELNPETAPVTNLLNLTGLTLQKQAGLPPTPYELFWAREHRSIMLESDVAVKLQ